MNKLESEALEALWKKDWLPESWGEETKDDIDAILKAIKDINRGIIYREDLLVLGRMKTYLIAKMWLSTRNHWICRPIFII